MTIGHDQNFKELISTNLVEGDEQRFQSEIDKMNPIQKEEIMQITTSWEEKGMEKERRSLALRMLQEGATLQFVEKVTGLTVEQLQQLQSQAGQN